jgi:serine/threonine protein kinase
MADVFEALHPELNRVVALKVLNPALMYSEEARARFRREARSVAALRHPNIVQLFDFDIVDDVYFMVMEFIEGETLNQRLIELQHQGGRMPLPEALRVVSAVGQALHYAHERGMFHRDIKPSNIMFRDDGSVVLTDFGVAKILDVSTDITKTGAVAGTPAYMAPEQWTDDEPDRRIDIYSLGIVLFQLTTGELPFTDTRPGRLMFKHISEPPPLPRELAPNIPLELERVILRALAKKPQDRFQTARELVRELETIIYEVESTAPTGVFRRPSIARGAGRGSAHKSLKSLGPRSILLWLAGGTLAVLAAIVALLLGGFVGSGGSEATPNATGTAMAGRLANLESTLSITPTPSPLPSTKPLLTPSETPFAQAAMATGTAEAVILPSPSPTRCDLRMTLEQDVNFNSFDWWTFAGAPFDKTWHLANDGDCPWPEDTILLHLEGQDFGFSDPYDVGAAAAGAKVELSVSLEAPSTPGQYEGRFQLKTGKGYLIGEPLSVRIVARVPSSPTPQMTEPVRVEGHDLIEWTTDLSRHVWHGKVALWARGGTGSYTWYQDTLDNPMEGDILEFERAMCGAFSGSVIVVSGDTEDHYSLYIPYPEPCD